MNTAARVYAGYTLSRNLSIAVALLGLLALRARRGLGGMLGLFALIQLMDIVVDAANGRLALLPGLAALVLLALSAAWQLTKPPLPGVRVQRNWRRASQIDRG